MKTSFWLEKNLFVYSQFYECSTIAYLPISHYVCDVKIVRYRFIQKICLGNISIVMKTLKHVFNSTSMCNFSFSLCCQVILLINSY